MARAKTVFAGAFFALQMSGAAPSQEPGWHHSPLPGEGDRAALGCARGSEADNFTCLAVRCEDDFSVGVHVHGTRPGGDAGAWEMTIDRENRTPLAEESDAPYGAKFREDADWLLDRLRHGSFVYLRHADDEAPGFAFITLAGSFAAIHRALYHCAPRVRAES